MRVALRPLLLAATQQQQRVGGSCACGALSAASRRSASSAASSCAKEATAAHPEVAALRTWVGGGCALGGALGVGVVGAYALTDDDGRSSVAFAAFDTLAWLSSALLDPEKAHQLAVWSAGVGLCPRELRDDPASLRSCVFGLSLRNPLGLAAGFDKDGECYAAMHAMGFGFVEVGSVTPLPQPGNAKPRVFRLREHEAVINRYGFNSEGARAVARRMRADEEAGVRTAGLVLGINVGKNKESPDAAGDYVTGIATLGQFADYLVINVSSPNTPGLRLLQAKRELRHLIDAAARARDALVASTSAGGNSSAVKRRKPLLVKIAPDLSDGELSDIASVCLRSRVDGIIVSNTTLSRDAVAGHEHADEPGGLSGRPLMEPSTVVLRKMYKLTKGRIPLIGCGGVASGRDAYEKIRAGASLVQIYTALAVQGPGVVPRIKRELAACLEADAIERVGDAIGLDA